MVKDEIAAVSKAVEDIRNAMLSGDRAALENVAHPALSYGHSGHHIEDRAEFADAIATGKSTFVTLAFNEQTIQVDGDTAIVRNIFEGDTNDGGKPGHAHIGVMMVLKKNEQGAWKMYARQAYKLPQGAH